MKATANVSLVHEAAKHVIPLLFAQAVTQTISLFLVVNVFVHPEVQFQVMVKIVKNAL